jgi:hypothetical protein
LAVEQEFWVLKCKVCGQSHTGGSVDTTRNNLNVPFDGSFKCPLRPGRTEHYRSSDWTRMSESQAIGLESTERDS